MYIDTDYKKHILEKYRRYKCQIIRHLIIITIIIVIFYNINYKVFFNIFTLVSYSNCCIDYINDLKAVEVTTKKYIEVNDSCFRPARLQILKVTENLAIPELITELTTELLNIAERVYKCFGCK